MLKLLCVFGLLCCLTGQVSAAMKSYKTIVYEAVRREPSDFQFASSDLQDNMGFVLKLVELDWRVIQYASSRLRYDKRFIIKAVRLNPEVVKGLPKRLTNNRDSDPVQIATG